MARTPNMANGKLLKAMADRFGLTDPFRVLNPNKTAFSYLPHDWISFWSAPVYYVK
jgi:hypothetical protein